MSYAASKWAKTDLECFACHSSRGLAVDKQGRGFCFSCNKSFTEKEVSDNVHVENVVSMDKGRRKDFKPEESEVLKFMYSSQRSIDKDVFEFFGVKTGFAAGNVPICLNFEYPNGRILVKDLQRKGFRWLGEKTQEGGLFGSTKFPAGSAKAITVTEGALDGLSAYQMLGKKYPVVSVTSVSTAKAECAAAYEYLNSFEKIYLCLDSDTPGKEATAAVARLFDFNKVYIVSMTKKDPNEYLEAKEGAEYVRHWWAAKRFLPEGILSSYTDFDKVIDDDVKKEAVPYPFGRLQQMTYGARTGELVLLTAQEGIGKTEIFRALEYHFLKETDENIGIIHLEEGKARTLKGLAGYELRSPIHLPDYEIPKEELKKTLRELTKRDERVHIYSHFGSDDPDVILSTVRFLAGSCNCKRIFMDHITMVVSGLAGDDERRALDYISTRLAMMVEELDFTLFLISHVNDEGQTRGSRNIGKVADLRIDMHRDLKSTNDIERNTTYLTIAKNRFAGKTGPAGALFFDSDTYVLDEFDPDAPPF